MRDKLFAQKKGRNLYCYYCVYPKCDTGRLTAGSNNKRTPQKVAFFINVFIVLKAVHRLGLRAAHCHYLEEKRWWEFRHIFAFLCCWDSLCFSHLPGSWVLSAGGCCSPVGQKPPASYRILADSDWKTSFGLQYTWLKVTFGIQYASASWLWKLVFQHVCR